MKKYLNYAHFGLLVGICAFVYFIYNGLTTVKLTSPNDLTEIKGTYIKHSFKENIGLINSTHQYYIWTTNYSNTFQVKADYLRFFNREQFARNIKLGDSIVFTIPSYLKTKLNSEENVFVTSILANSVTHLDKTKVLDFEKHLADTNMDYVFAFGYLAAGLWVYFSKRKNYR